MPLNHTQASKSERRLDLDFISCHNVESLLPQEPLTPARAKLLIRRIREAGDIALSGEARKRMQERSVSAIEIDHALRAGVVDPGEYANGSWRYRVSSHHICVVIAFDSAVELIVVTTWRW